MTKSATITMYMICGNCGAKCESVHTVSWTNKAVCEKCQLGNMYWFINYVQINRLPYWQRRIIAIVTSWIPFFWGFNTCAHCGLTPPFGRHCVDCEGWGSSLLCYACFEELPLNVKLKYHREHCLQYGEVEKRWEELRDAVIRDHRLIPFRESLQSNKNN